MMNRMKHFFLPQGFINHNIAQKVVFSSINSNHDGYVLVTLKSTSYLLADLYDWKNFFFLWRSWGGRWWEHVLDTEDLDNPRSKTIKIWGVISG